MKKVFLITTALFVALGISSCKKDENSTPKDTTKPSVSLTSPNDKDEFISGNEISISATITDDTELSQAKIEIHEAFDGHTHLKTGATAFEWDSIIDLTGKQTTLNIKVAIPIDVAAGTYHFTIKVLDKAGNEADFVEADIVLKNADDLVAPTLNVVPTPSVGTDNEIHLHGNDKELTLVATVTDDKGLKAYEIKLINKGTKVNYIDIDGELNGTSDGFTEKITFDDAWPKGDYLLVIEAFDLKNNDVDVEFDVHRD